MIIDQPEEISERIARHLEEVRTWLDENVTVYDDVRSVTLHTFNIDWNDLGGSFQISVNGERCELPFSFGCRTATGKPEVYFPMFHSPLGAPASYAAIVISEQVIEHIKGAIGKLMPSLKPLGLDSESGKELTYQTPLHERLPSRAELQAAKAVTSQANFSIKLDFS